MLTHTHTCSHTHFVVPCGDLCYDQLVGAVQDFEETVAQESVTLSAINLDSADDYTTFQDAFDAQRDTLAAQEVPLDEFPSRHESVQSTLQSIATDLEEFSNVRLSQAQLILSRAQQLRAAVQARMNAIPPALDDLAEDVDRASAREARGEAFRAQAQSIVDDSAVDAVAMRARQPEINNTLSSALSYEDATQELDECIQGNTDDAQALDTQLRGDLLSLEDRVHVAVLDRFEASEEAGMLQGRLSTMSSQVSAAAASVAALTAVDTSTGDEEARLASATAVAASQVVAPLNGNTSVQLDTYLAVKEELAELSTQIASSISATASSQSVIDENAAIASTAVDEVRAMISGGFCFFVSLFAFMCGCATVHTCGFFLPSPKTQPCLLNMCVCVCVCVCRMRPHFI